MARLVAAECPQCGAGVKLDPKLEYVTCTYCGTSSFIETRKRPVTAQIEQAHVPVIKVEPPKMGWFIFPIVLTVLISAMAILIGALAPVWNTVKDLAGLQAIASSTVAQVLEQAKLPTSLAALNQDLFQDASPFKSQMEAEIGSPLKVTELVLYPGYAFVTAQSPKNPEHVDRYPYRGGSIGTSEIVKLTSHGKKELSQRLFELSKVDFTLIPGLVADAVKAIPIEEAKVTHIIVDRFLPFTKEVRFRVYVNGSRESGGYVEYSLAGKRGRVVK